MSNEYSNYTPRPGVPRWVKTAAIGFAGLLAGSILGATTLSFSGDSATEIITPESCVDAVTLSEAALSSAGDATNATAAMYQSYISEDMDAYDEASSDLDRSTERIQELTPDYHSSRDDCLSSVAE